MSTTARPAPSRERLDEPLPGEGLVLAAAMGAATAGAIHLVVVPEHWGVSAPMSAFFIALGVGQLLLAAGLRWRLPDAVLVVVIMGHLAVMGLYVASRSVDLPFVPPHDAAHEMEHLPVPRGVGNGIPLYPGSRVEPVGMLDLVCLAAELVLVVSLAALLPPRLRSVVTTVMAGAAVLAVVWRVWVLS
ncbi:hypothetical protein [Nocardioides sp. P5_C9_2]